MNKIQLFFLIVILFFNKINSQIEVQDSLFLMNGIVLSEKIIDTTLGAVSIYNPKKIGEIINYESDQLFMVKYAEGYKRYYYYQDTSTNNYLSREDMRLFMRGERDARNKFKAKGAFVTGIVLGFVGGSSGTFWGPILPFGFTLCNGLFPIKIKQEYVSDVRLVDSDAYLMGFERVVKQKRKVKSLLGGAIGLVGGYVFYFAFHQYYPK